MDLAPPDCHSDQQSSCAEADWVQCAECSRFICKVHDEAVPVRYSWKFAANIDSVCTRCGQNLFELGEVSVIKNGYQYVNRR